MEEQTGNQLEPKENGVSTRDEDHSLQEYSAPAEEKQMSCLEHLEELRWHIIRSLAAIMVFAVAAFAAKDLVWGILILGPTEPDFWTFRQFCKIGSLVGSDAFCLEEMPFIIQSRKMTGQFTMHIYSSAVIGLIASFPYVFFEIWRFISPGLYEQERKLSRGAVFFVSTLFLIGVLFGYYVVTPISVNFLGNYQVDPSILNEFDITSYVGILITLVLACGLLFQLPIVVYFLSKAGIITPKSLITYRRHAIVVILIISALVTPPDPVTQLLVTFPLILLYQASILISRWVLRKKEKAEAAAENQ
ncbi:MAG: twin-arginine translocase subunit TatC [Cyclobacteriaceae bacterium]